MAYEETASRDKVYVSLSVAFVFLVVGIPLWWKTTEVYRASLPYSEIENLAESQTIYAVHVKVIVFADDVDGAVVAGLQENLAQSLNDDKRISDLLSFKYNVFSRFADDKEKLAFKKARNIQELDLSLWKVGGRGQEDDYRVYFLPKSRALDCKDGVAGNRAGLFLASDDLAETVPLISRIVRKNLVREETIDRAYHTAAGAILDQTDKDSMRTLRSEPAYDVTLTLLNTRPDLVNVQWDVRRAVQMYMKSFLETMAPYVEFHIKSQVLYYVDLPEKPSYDEKLKHHYLKHDSLPHLIIPIERELASFTSNRQHINLVVYATPPEHTPLYMRNQKGVQAEVNAFLSPRWGGLMIYNLAKPGPNASYPVPMEMDMKEVMEVLVTQLRLLVGLDSSMPSMEPITVADNDERAVNFMELSYWLRKRTLENCGIATSALSSLSQLLATISNIVITDDIAKEIHTAVEAIKESRMSLMGARLHQAFKFSRQALVAAETAFFDQSLLELLYFPDDQKFAIYIPLFLPVSLPVVISTIQALKWLKNKRSKKEKTS